MKKTSFFLVSLALFLYIITSFFPYGTEFIFSRNINKWTIQGLSLITGILPFSLMEIFVALIVIFIIYGIIYLIRSLLLKKKVNFTKFIFYLSLAFFIFISFWSLNYHRLPFDKIVGIEVKKSSTLELETLCKSLIQKSNELRLTLDEDKNGVATYNKSNKYILSIANLGYEAASEKYPFFKGTYGKPKSIMLSKLMNYTGIIGIYCPFTGEASIDTAIPKFTIPSTVCHEMAHQRGFAKEDEADYIAYITCTMHPNNFFKYSGTIMALIHSMNAMSNVDSEKFSELTKLYSEEVRRDLNYDYYFWKNYQGKIEKVSDKVNDTYLKANGQKDGTQSYGRMIDLLLAEQRSNKK